mgnify:CR=1 FL=1
MFACYVLYLEVLYRYGYEYECKSLLWICIIYVCMHMYIYVREYNNCFSNISLQFLPLHIAENLNQKLQYQH